MFNFNVRVYGLYLVNDKILLSDEFVKGQRMTKFPGGGLEDGEGTRDCLKREWEEELNQKIEVTTHFYTTDFYQKSGFGDGSQVISIYYFVRPEEELKVKISEKPFDFKEEVRGAQAFRLFPVRDITEKTVTLPIDKVVAGLLHRRFN